MITKVTQCIHCYCKSDNSNGIPHKVCCNCGNKQARMNDTTWNPYPSIQRDQYYWDTWPWGAIRVTD